MATHVGIDKTVSKSKFGDSPFSIVIKQLKKHKSFHCIPHIGKFWHRKIGKFDES